MSKRLDRRDVARWPPPERILPSCGSAERRCRRAGRAGEQPPAPRLSVRRRWRFLAVVDKFSPTGDIRSVAQAGQQPTFLTEGQLDAPEPRPPVRDLAPRAVGGRQSHCGAHPAPSASGGLLAIRVAPPMNCPRGAVESPDLGDRSLPVGDIHGAGATRYAVPGRATRRPLARCVDNACQVNSAPCIVRGERLRVLAVGD
jgi:hypothetical protein